MPHDEVETLRRQLETYIDQHDSASRDPDEQGRHVVEEGEYRGKDAGWKPPTHEEIHPPERLLGAPIDGIVAYADTLISHDVLSPRQAVIYALVTLTSRSVAIEVLDDVAEGTIDATASQARQRLRTGLVGYMLTLDGYRLPLQLHHDWAADVDGGIPVTHPTGTYHLFEEKTTEWTLGRARHADAYTLFIEVQPNRHRSQADCRTQRIDIERFADADALREWLYDDQLFDTLAEAEHWHAFVDAIPDITPEVAPADRVQSPADNMPAHDTRR